MNNQCKYNTYIGARYVPIVTGEWDVNLDYEPLTIVTYQGDSYTSKGFVPKGIPVTNEQYWVKTGNFNQQIAGMQEQINQIKNDFPTNIVWQTSFNAGLDSTGMNDCSDIFTNATTGIGLKAGTYLINKDCTINVPLFFADGAEINCQANVTFNAGLMAGRYTILSGNINSVKIYGVDEYYPEWFGAKNNGITDCYNAFTATINAIGRTGAIKLLDGKQGSYDSTNDVWLPGTCYYISKPINFNKAFCRLYANSYGVIFSAAKTAITFGSGNTSSQLERISAENLVFISGYKGAGMAEQSDPNNFLVRFIGCQAGKFVKFRCLGNPNSYYYTYNTANIYESFGSNPNVTNAGFRAHWIDNTNRNWSSSWNGCGASIGGQNNPDISYGMYIKGVEGSDLFFRDCEIVSCGVGVYYDNSGASSGYDINFDHLILDQIKYQCFNCVLDYPKSMINIVNSYFQRQAVNADIPMTSFTYATNYNEVVNINNSVFYNTDPTTPAIYASAIMNITNCFMYESKMLKISGNGFNVNNCIADYSKDNVIDSFIEITGSIGPLAALNNIKLYNRSGHSSTTNGGIYFNSVKGQCSVVNVGITGAGITTVANTNNNSNVFISQVGSLNKIPGFTHS